MKWIVSAILIVIAGLAIAYLAGFILVGDESSSEIATKVNQTKVSETDLARQKAAVSYEKAKQTDSLDVSTKKDVIAILGQPYKKTASDDPAASDICFIYPVKIEADFYNWTYCFLGEELSSTGQVLPPAK
mgnify:CR=1 FL=1